MIGTGGYVLAVFALVIGFAAGTVAGAVSDWVRDTVYALRTGGLYVLAVCGIVGVLYVVGRAYYATH